MKEERKGGRDGKRKEVEVRINRRGNKMERSNSGTLETLVSSTVEAEMLIG